jgi:hypothetical protein
MFAALAARTDKGVACLQGMRRLADLLHPHGVKITWHVSAESARQAKEDLTKWHEEFGDEATLCVPEPLVGTREEKKRGLLKERDGIQQALPWADLSIAAGGHQDPEAIQILDELEFKGLWGFCWEQIEVDQITDRGSPWGFYYIDPAQRLRPASGRGIIGMEWTARDLLKSFHSGNPCLYSTDPNDVARGGICAWENIDYWKGMADNYLRNTRYNDFVFLLQHQEAHETECNEFFQCYTEEDIREANIMLEEFVKHIKASARMLTLHEAAELYRENFEKTSSSYMLWEDTPVCRPNPDYAWSTAWGPWPKTFLHYDRGAQMMFVEGQVHPVCIRNYSRALAPGEYFSEPLIPRAKLVSNTQLSWDREVEVKVQSPSAMPYGIALWGDYSLYQIAEAPGLLEGKILSRELLFLRYDLVEGQNVFKVRLKGK